MIQLDVRPYCADCEDFDPEVKKFNNTYLNGLGEAVRSIDTTVKCRYRNRCAAIYRYLVKEHGKRESEMPSE